MDHSTPETRLDALEIFASLDPAERETLAAEFATVSLNRGCVLLRQGDTADALYVVVSGRFSVTVDGRRAPLAEIGPGQPIGEIAFLAGGTRTATVTAMRDSLLLRLDRADFEALSIARPSIWRTLTITLAQRLARETAIRPAPPDPRPRTIVVVRAGASPVPAAFTARLADVLRRHATSRVVTSSELARHLHSRAGIDTPEATRAMNALEYDADFVLFLADAEVTPWSEKVIRQADMVLAVGDSGAAPAPNALEKLAETYVSREGRRLVLIHPRRGPTTGTARWLTGRELAMHHHVALDGDSDLERLFRFINGTALGLVACGGGAFCTAHTGVYQALIEAGLKFDIMGGTSGGSAFTAAFALGTAPERIDEVVRDIFVTHGAMRRYTLPIYSIVDHTHYDRQLYRHFGGIDIEDLWIPYFAISTDLSSYELYRHRAGELWSAVRASGSVPGLLPPYYTPDGRMLVDGCLLDNVPIKAMREIKSGPNVVVNFRPPDLERFDVDYGSLPSRGELAWSALTIWKKRSPASAPPIHTVLLRSLMANRLDYRRHMTAEDLMLSPPFPADMGVLDWHRHGELRSLSYAWCRTELDRLAREGHPCLEAAGVTATGLPPTTNRD
ncbi:MAG: patatin-like phospholipase family protein [Hyphomicrobium sp.]